MSPTFHRKIIWHQSVAWAARCPKSPVKKMDHMFNNMFIKAPHHWPFVRWIHQSVGFPSQKASNTENVFMPREFGWMIYVILCNYLTWQLGCVQTESHMFAQSKCRVILRNLAILNNVVWLKTSSKPLIANWWLPMMATISNVSTDYQASSVASPSASRLPWWPSLHM